MNTEEKIVKHIKDLQISGEKTKELFKMFNDL